MTDMKDCLEHITLLDSEEKDMSQSILRSEKHTDWLQEKESSILEIGLQPPPTSLNNPLSFTSALIATTPRNTAQFPVLAFFCMHRNNEFVLEDKSGSVVRPRQVPERPTSSFIIDHRPSLDLSSLENQEFFSKAQKNLKDGRLLLNALLLSLPEDGIVFVIIESLTALGKWERWRQGDQKLRRIIGKREHLVVKVLVTDALAGSDVKSEANIPLYVRDEVNGYGVIDVVEIVPSHIVNSKAAICTVPPPINHHGVMSKLFPQRPP